METTYSYFPSLKKELKDLFGYLSFNVSLINVDIIGIMITGQKYKNEVVVITFRGATKTGFMYDGSLLSNEQALRIYQDVPDNYNDLEKYKEKFADKIEVLPPLKDNYVFINEMEIIEKENK